MKFKFVIPNMEKTFGQLEYAGEDEIKTARGAKGRQVVSRSYNLFSSVQRADDVCVVLPARAGEKQFEYEQKVKLVNPRIEASAVNVGGTGFSDYILMADDMIADVKESVGK